MRRIVEIAGVVWYTEYYLPVIWEEVKMAEIVFVVPTSVRTIKQEVNGTLLLATRLLQAGFDTRILRFCEVESFGGDYADFIRDITHKILAQSPRCVSFYALWPTYHTMLRIARELKALRPELQVVLGGPQATATAAVTMEHMEFVDCICTGEGENTVVPFFTALLRRGGEGLAEIPGLYYRTAGGVAFCDTENPLCDLNDQPYWDDRLYLDLYTEPDDYTRSDTYDMPLDVGRGCPYSCTFCCTSHFWRRTYRLKSPQRVVDEMRYYHEKFGIRSFKFAHDAFTINHHLVGQVCDRILEEGLDFRWNCTTRIDCITEELILKMKQAGMRRIEVGIETGSPRMQKLINKRLDLEKARRMIAFLLDNKIRVSLFFIYGLPEETEEDLAQTLSFVFEMMDRGVRNVLMSICCFTPTTAITERFYDELVYDPKMEVLFHSFYGDEADLQMIRENKSVFPVYYNLPTTIRRDYQYLRYLVNLYARFPKGLRQLRRQYGGDDLRLYRDFEEKNREVFAQGLAHVETVMEKEPLLLALNLLRDREEPWISQLRELLRFEQDLHFVFSRRENSELRKSYNFSYADLKLDRPIERYVRGQSEIWLRTRDGKANLQVLRLEMED